jgi:hypothetical protein
VISKGVTVHQSARSIAKLLGRSSVPGAQFALLPAGLINGAVVRHPKILLLSPCNLQ